MELVNLVFGAATGSDSVNKIASVVESESAMHFSATDEIIYFELVRVKANFLRVDACQCIVQDADECREKPPEHSSLECPEFKSVSPSSSIIALQEVLEKMI